LILTMNLWAQLTVSTLRGTATDPAGAVVVNAHIAVVQLATNLTREINTNANGDFEILDLPRGQYRLTATAPGFKTFVAENILLESSQVRRIDVALELGAAGVEVTVHADAAVIATETGKIQETFEKQRFEELPLIGDGRTPDAVLISLPMIQNAGSVYSVQMAGQPVSQIQMGQDGHTNDGSGNQINNYHDIQEVVAVAVNNSAEFARVGYFDMTTKAGSNKLHVDLGYWHQNSSLGARDFFATTKPVAKAHTMVASAGGRIRKDKTFFYASWNEQLWPGGIFYTRNVPTNQMRAGDFSELLAGSKPTIVKDPLNGVLFARAGPGRPARSGAQLRLPVSLSWRRQVVVLLHSAHRSQNFRQEHDPRTGERAMGRLHSLHRLPCAHPHEKAARRPHRCRGYTHILADASQHGPLRLVQGDSHRRRYRERLQSGKRRPGDQAVGYYRCEPAEPQRHGIPYHGHFRLLEYRHPGGRRHQ
jgi:hypothetical protein